MDCRDCHHFHPCAQAAGAISSGWCEQDALKTSRSIKSFRFGALILAGCMNFMAKEAEDGTAGEEWEA